MANKILEFLIPNSWLSGL